MDSVARLSQDRIDNSILHTTCVATKLNAGHANNALPQRAEANVNCRIEPGHTSEEIRQKLIEVFADPKVTVRYVANDGTVMDRGTDRKSYAPAELRADLLASLDKIVGQMWPGVPSIPSMSTGASDGVYTSAAGMPTYEVGGITAERGDSRAHGQDERVLGESFYGGVDFYYRFLKDLTSGR
jgi:acetylornithine deacetylase/succinyl-diaminopimelate desuccinylase-like protein